MELEDLEVQGILDLVQKVYQGIGKEEVSGDVLGEFLKSWVVRGGIFRVRNFVQIRENFYIQFYYYYCMCYNLFRVLYVIVNLLNILCVLFYLIL